MVATIYKKLSQCPQAGTEPLTCHPGSPQRWICYSFLLLYRYRYPDTNRVPFLPGEGSSQIHDKPCHCCPLGLRAVGLKLESTSECPGGLVKTQTAGPSPQQSLATCISNKFPGDPGNTLWEPTLIHISQCVCQIPPNLSEVMLGGMQAWY